MNMLKYHFSITSANARSNNFNVFQPNGYKEMFLSQSNLNPLFYKNLVYESQPPYLDVVAQTCNTSTRKSKAKEFRLERPYSNANSNN